MLLNKILHESIIQMANLYKQPLIPIISIILTSFINSFIIFFHNQIWRLISHNNQYMFISNKTITGLYKRKLCFKNYNQWNIKYHVSRETNIANRSTSKKLNQYTNKPIFALLEAAAKNRMFHVKHSREREIT